MRVQGWIRQKSPNWLTIKDVLCTPSESETSRMKKWIVILIVVLLTVFLGYRVSQALKQQAKPAAAPRVAMPTVEISKVRLGPAE